MFFKKKNQDNCGIIVMTSNGPQVLGAANQLGNGAIATSGVHEEIERQVKKRLANQQFEEEFKALPEYRVTEHYDVTTHKDHYQLERKQLQCRNGWHSTPSDKADYDVIWTIVYRSESKSEVTSRFARVMPKKTARKKAA